MNTRNNLTMLVCMLLGLCAAPTDGAAQAEERIPALRAIPVQLPVDVRTPLAKRRAELEQEFARFKAEADAFSQRPASEQTDAEYDALQARRTRYIAKARAFNAEVGQATDAYLRKHIDELSAQIAGDLEAIKRLKLDKRAEEFEEWAKLSKDARADLENQALDALITVSLSGVQAGAKIVASHNPWLANEMIGHLRTLGVNDPFLLEAIKKVGATKGKPAMAKAVNEWLDAIGKARDVYSIAKDGAKAGDLTEKKNAALGALATVLSWGVEDPKLSLLVTEIQVATAALYNNVTQRVVSSRVEQLLHLADEELKSLKRLQGRLTEHMKQRRAEREALASSDFNAKLRALQPPEEPKSGSNP